MAEKNKDPVQGPALYPASYVNEKLEALDQDELTGLLNRSGFNRAFEARLYNAEKGKAKPGLLELDLNNFKLLNDTFGHQAGDEFLRSLGELLKSSLRLEDPEHPDIARVGGDEFFVLLDLTPREPSDFTPEERIAKVKERILSGVADLIGLEFSDYQASGLNVAVGWSVWQAGMTAREMIDEADRKMYEHKDETKEGLRSVSKSDAA